MAELVPINPLWPGAWDSLKGYLERAIEIGGSAKHWGVEDLKLEALAGRMQMWGLVENDKVHGAMMTKELRFPKCRALEVAFAAADENTEERWLPLWPVLANMARAAGFDSLIFAGRKGWERKLGVKPLYRFEWELTQ